MDVYLVLNISDLINAGLFLVNILGLLWFLATIRKGLRDYESQRE